MTELKFAMNYVNVFSIRCLCVSKKKITLKKHNDFSLNNLKKKKKIKA